jgi:hypothetical protein
VPQHALAPAELSAAHDGSSPVMDPPSNSFCTRMPPGATRLLSRSALALCAAVIALTAVRAAAAEAAEGISATEGQAFSGQVSEAPCAGTSGVTIEWGDGSSSAGTVGGFSHNLISGIHTYAEEGNAEGTVSWTGSDCGAGSTPFSAAIADAPLSATGVSLSSAAGQTFSGAVASFTDADPNGVASDYTATINWGDGSASPGDGHPVTVTPGPSGAFTVNGSHGYATAGSYKPDVNITDKGGASTSTQGGASITACVEAGGCGPPPGGGGGPGYGGGGGSPESRGCPALPDGNADPHANWRVLTDAYDNGGLAAVLQFVTVTGEPISVVFSGCARVSGPSPLPLIVPRLVFGARRAVAALAHSSSHGTPPPCCAINLFARDGFTHGALITFTPGSIISIGGLALDASNVTIDTYTGEVLGGANVGLEHAESADPSIPNYPGLRLSASPLIGHVDLTSSPWYLGAGDTGTFTGRGDVSSFRYLDGTVSREANAGNEDLLNQQRTDVNSAVQLPAIFTDSMGRALTEPDDYHLQEAYVPSTRLLEISGPAAAALGTPAGTARMVRPAPRARTADDPQCPAGIGPLDMNLGVLQITGATFGYDPATGVWRGCGTLDVFLGKEIQISAHFGVKESSLVDAGGELAGDVPLGGAVTLNNLGVEFFSGPPTRFAGNVKLTVAGIIGVDGRLFAVFANEDHCYEYKNELGQAVEYPPPFCHTALGLSGEASLPLLGNVASGYGLLVDEAPLYIEGGVSFRWPVNLLGWNLGEIYGGVHGWVQVPRFNFEADIGAKLLGVGVGSALVAVSNVGIAGCAEIGYATIGFGHAWDGSNDQIYLPFPAPPVKGIHFGGCDQQPWRAHKARASSASRIDVAAGLPFESLQLVGTGGVPSVTLSGPHGESFSTPDDGSIYGRDGDFVYYRPPGLDRTYIAIGHPSAGAWTIAAKAGSPAVGQALASDGLGPPSVNADVSGSGRKRTLHYRISRRPRQGVTFLEHGRGAGKVLGVTGGGRGTLRFTPADGPAGRREIVAQITLSGLPDGELVVARYVAPPPPVPSQPRGVHLARHGSTIRISWGASAAASAYAISVHASDGRHMAFFEPGSTRSLSVPGFAFAGASATVAGERTNGRLGPGASGRLSAVPPPASVRGLHVLLGKTKLVISWRAARHAARYQVNLRVGKGRPLQLVTPAHTIALHLHVKRLPVSVSVRAEDAALRFGVAVNVRAQR